MNLFKSSLTLVQRGRFVAGFAVFIVAVHISGMLLRVPENSLWWSIEPWALLAAFLAALARREATARQHASPSGRL